MYSPLVCVLSMLFWNSFAFGQSDKKITVTGQPIINKDVIFVSDVHYHNGDMSFIGAFSNYAYEQYGITDVVIEMGTSWTYLINRYIQDNDSAFFYFKPRSVNVKMLEKWRAINKNLPHDKQITIHGIDFERMDFVVALRSIFARQLQFADHASGLTATELYKYIVTLPDSVCNIRALGAAQKKVTVATYDRARGLFEQERDNLKVALKDDFEITAQILENPVTQKHFGKRDIAMGNRLADELAGKKFVCFLGYDHVDMHRHFSALRKYIRNTGNHNITVVSEVCRNFPAVGNHAGEYMTMGPPAIVKNDSVQLLGFGKYQQNGYYTLVNQEEFRDIIKANRKGMPTYYVFSDILHE